jgi:PPK2 family polyphosphate:nucleotide phosphotransferase
VKGRDFLVVPGTRVRLRDLKTHSATPFGDKKEAQEALEKDVEEMAELQRRLYAMNSWSLLLIFQAMDAAGKDSTIRHVMSGLNPQGCQVFSFRAPSDEELDHDYLWRTNKNLPERGRIGVFNRSYYEEVLVVRVHPELLDKQRLPVRPKKLRTLWDERYEDINALERYLTRNGTVIRKFFLHVSRDEQKKRFLERLETPRKHWKFSARDVEERSFWNDYMKAYERMLEATSTDGAPWYVIPADNEWFTRYTVARIIVSTLRDLKLEYPALSGEDEKALKSARKELIGGDGENRKRTRKRKS